MTSTFQCEYCQCFTFKRCDKFKLKCTSDGGMYSAQYFWKKHNVKTVNIEILRCCRESISMNVSDLIIYIMKIM